jgi:hypothetical protein
MLERNWFVDVDISAFLNLFSREGHMNVFARSIRFNDDCRGNKYFPAGQPIADIHYHILDGPGLIIEIELFDMTDISVCCADRIVLQLSYA